MTYLKLRDSINGMLGKDTKIRPLLEFAQGVDFGFRYLRHEVLPAPKVAATREIYVEWVNYCNLRCSFCALDHSMHKERMALETWRRVLHEILTPKFAGVEAVHLHNGGETLLHPKSEEFLAELDQIFLPAMERGQHVPKVDLLTNGMVLTDKKRAAIHKTLSISTLQFSMDGGSPEQFESIRTRAKWETFYPQIVQLLRENKELEKPKRIGIIALMPDAETLKRKNFHPEYQEILDLADDVEFRLAHNWAGQIGEDGLQNVPSKPWKLGCNMMMDQLVVFPNGGVSICCNDLNSKAVVGNFLEVGLAGAYDSPKRKSWLASMARNQKQDIDLCRDCERF